MSNMIANAVAFIYHSAFEFFYTVFFKLGLGDGLASGLALFCFVGFVFMSLLLALAALIVLINIVLKSILFLFSFETKKKVPMSKIEEPVMNEEVVLKKESIGKKIKSSVLEVPRMKRKNSNDLFANFR